MERQIIGAALRGQRENPLLFMFAGRDEMPSEFRPADLRIALGRLKERRLEELVGEFLGANEIDSGLLDVIRTTSEGNPLYVDEVIRSLKQGRQVEVDGKTARLVGDASTVHLPVNLEGMIAARIDALGLRRRASSRQPLPWA